MSALQDELGRTQAQLEQTRELLAEVGRLLVEHHAAGYQAPAFGSPCPICSFERTSESIFPRIEAALLGNEPAAALPGYCGACGHSCEERPVHLPAQSAELRHRVEELIAKGQELLRLVPVQFDGAQGGRPQEITR